MEKEKIKKNYVKADSQATIPISAKIEPELEKAWKESNMSVRALMWRGIRSLEGDPHHVEVVHELRDEIKNMKVTQKYIYQMVDMLLRERADRLRHRKNAVVPTESSS